MGQTALLIHHNTYSRTDCQRPVQNSVSLFGKGVTAIHPLCNAGQAAEFVIWQYDQYGNKVTDRAEPGLFLAHATGPGTMQTDITAQDTGKVTIM